MNRQLILTIVLIAALGGTGYIWYQYSQTTEVIPKPEFSEKTDHLEERLSELRRLKTLRIDTSIVEDPFFKSLGTPQEAINQPEVKSGRPNPFLAF